MEKVVYNGKIHTRNTTWSEVYIKLVGQDGESKHIEILGVLSFLHGKECTFTLSCPSSIGRLVLIEIEKQERLLLPGDSWFVDKVEVTSPEGNTYKFPIYTWIRDEEVHHFREGTALIHVEDHNLLGKYTREMQLSTRKKIYGWRVYAEGVPHCIKADHPASLPWEVRFSFTKDLQFFSTAAEGLVQLKLTHLGDCKKNWPSFEALSRVFHRHRTETSGYVQDHWKEDAFFGYQFLNGVNPILIQRCSSLPENFPVTEDMVFLHGAGSLADEIKKGNIFLCDYKNLDGVETSVINGKKQYLMAPLVLLHKTPDNDLKPIAIQLKQTPAEDNPIFLPTDDKNDWLLAKIFVRSAAFNEHELNVHLLRTHLLAEVFAVSLLRNLPMVHPLYKLLIPHTRYTLQINMLARERLISQDGVFTKYTSSGGEGMFTILQRSLSSLTYSSLCIPEDIKERGMESVPNYFYRDDGLKLWDIIHRFVKGVLSYYYKDDTVVSQDSELQKWIQDIFEHGFLSNASTGIPRSFTAVNDLVKFVTMVIFTCSAQHSAVNDGQFDFGGWMPNAPTSLQLPPPTKKGTAAEETLLNTLPDVSTTVHGMATLFLLTKQSTDFVALGQYPKEYFCEDVPCNLIKDFQRELEDLHVMIDLRNKSLELPYSYLDPKRMENSVSL